MAAISWARVRALVEAVPEHVGDAFEFLFGEVLIPHLAQPVLVVHESVVDHENLGLEEKCAALLGALSL